MRILRWMNMNGVTREVRIRNEYVRASIEHGFQYSGQYETGRN